MEHKLETAIKRVLQPLIDDGFVLKEINVPDGQITVNFVLETVENCMNNIGFKRNIFWTINERKEIYVNSIDYLFGLQPLKEIRDNKQENGLSKIQPKIENVDYANVINFKNVRLIYPSQSEFNSTKIELYPIVTLGKKIKKGDVINFDCPIIIDEDYLKNYIVEQNNQDGSYYNLNLWIKLDNGNFKTYSISVDVSNEQQGAYESIGSISFSNDNGEEGEIVLQRDSFYQNLITGFKWNYDGNGTIELITSHTALRYTTMRFMYSAEINKLKGVISESGQIEKTIDYQEKWTTLPQLIKYARSLITQNSNTINQVILEYDQNPDLELGNIIIIDRPQFYIQGKFAVKDIKYTYNNELDEKWTITVKSSDLVSSYIDLFRPEEKEENKKSIDTVILSEFVEEQINEVHSIEVEQD